MAKPDKRRRVVVDKKETPRVTYHHCHAERCTIRTKPEMLMCRRHWFMVPKALQRAVWNAYRPGQCNLKPPPSDAWMKAANQAIRAVAEKEGLRPKPANPAF